MGNSKIKNKQWKGLLIGLILMFLSAIMAVAPLLFSWDMMDIGFALQCLALMIMVLGVIISSLYLHRYLRLRNMLNGKDVLLHWVYPQKIHEKEVLTTKQEMRTGNMINLAIVWFFFIIITILFVFIAYAEGQQDDLPLFLGMMGSILLFVSVVAFIMPGFTYSNFLTSEVIIAKNGLYYMGQLHIWNNMLSYIDDAYLTEDNKYLVFKFKSFSSLGWFRYESYRLKILIPKTEVDQVKKAVTVLISN